MSVLEGYTDLSVQGYTMRGRKSGTTRLHLTAPHSTRLSKGVKMKHSKSYTALVAIVAAVGLSLVPTAAFAAGPVKACYPGAANCDAGGSGITITPTPVPAPTEMPRWNVPATPAPAPHELGQSAPAAPAVVTAPAAAAPVTASEPTFAAAPAAALPSAVIAVAAARSLPTLGLCTVGLATVPRCY